MGKSNNGMKIHWNGQVGRIVGYTSRGHDYWRSLASNYNNPRTDAQMLHRAKFAFTSAFIHDIGPAYKSGYAHYNTSKCQRANFFHQLYHDAVSGNLPSGFTIDPAKVLVSRGNLTPAYNILASIAAASHSVSFGWSDNSGVAEAKADDRLLYCIFNISRRQSIFSDNAATRADESAEASYPSAWAGDTLHIYAGWLNLSSASDSSFLGTFTA